MAAPFQVYTRALDPIKGFGAALHNVDKSTTFGTLGVTSRVNDPTGIPGGTCVHLDAAGKFMPGATGTQMPMWLLQNSQDPDVQAIDASPDAYNPTPSGRGSALVAIGGFELETTEYDKTATFAYNDPLHAPTEVQIAGSDKTKAGLLFNARNWPGGNAGAITTYTDAVCGIVSQPIHPNHQYVISVVRFWPVFFPGSGPNV